MAPHPDVFLSPPDGFRAFGALQIKNHPGWVTGSWVGAVANPDGIILHVTTPHGIILREPRTAKGSEPFILQQEIK